MSAGARVAAFLVALVVAGLLGAAVGAVAGPLDVGGRPAPDPPAHSPAHGSGG